MELNKPGHTRVEVRRVVRAEGRPGHHGTGNYRPETENLCRCRRFCWGVGEMFSADARGNNENKKRRNPGAIFVPAESQKENERRRLFPMWYQRSQVENSEPTEGHLFIDVIRDRRNMVNNIN